MNKPYKPTNTQLADALAPLVAAYETSIDPGHSDLYGEQPHTVTVRATLGDFRAAASIYHWLRREGEAERKQRSAA